MTDLQYLLSVSATTLLSVVGLIVLSVRKDARKKREKASKKRSWE